MDTRIARPDPRKAKADIKSIRALYKTLRSITIEKAGTKRRILRLAETLRKKNAREKFAQMRVDALNENRQRIPLSALKQAGYTTVDKLHGLSVAQISNIRGVGQRSAIKIKRTVDQIHDAVFSQSRVRIDPHNRSREQDRLIVALHRLKTREEPIMQARNLLTRYPGLAPNLNKAKRIYGVFAWPLSSRRKKESSLIAYAYLEHLMFLGFEQETCAIFQAYQQVLRTKSRSKDAYSDFLKDPVPYYTLLERYKPEASPLFSWGLPKGLVAQIEEYPLDLTYMKSPLRQYQIFGTKYFLHQKKALLGDEMGLGKTIQALAAIADLMAKGHTHFIVICPASILINWKRETEKHSEIKATIVHGHNKEQQLEEWKRDGGLCVTNYESVVRVGDGVDFKFGALIVDEAHFIKNPLAQRTVAALSVAKKSDRILFMTGTPLENRVDEMCFLTECLRPDIAKKLCSMKTVNRTQKFKQEIAPVYLRRLRDDVLGELPELIEVENWIEPTPEELSAYRSAVMSGNFMAMRRVSWDVASHRSSKAKRLVEICDEAHANGRKVLVFSFFLGTLQLVCKLLAQRALGPITGGVPTGHRQRLIDQFTEGPNEKVLVSQIQAGGMGLNIQAASVVIICEPQIKPSLETQAISRSYRMGQIHNVVVHRLLCANTVDEKMNEMLKRKQLEFDTYADESLVGEESLKTQSENAWAKRFVEEERQRIIAI